MYILYVKACLINTFCLDAIDNEKGGEEKRWIPLLGLHK